MRKFKRENTLELAEGNPLSILIPAMLWIPFEHAES